MESIVHKETDCNEDLPDLPLGLDTSGSAPMDISSEISSQRELEVFPKAGSVVVDVPREVDVYRCPESEDRWHPFGNEASYNFARWLIDAKVSNTDIDKLLNPNVAMPLDSQVRESFSSAYALRQKIEQMADGFGWMSWKFGRTNLKWNTDDSENIGRLTHGP
jgi:hypothetical protein